MFNLEEMIQRWRESMQAAGIGPGPVRDELESHLRDGLDAGLRSGLNPASAFAKATLDLGQPQDLHREYHAAHPFWARVRSLLRRRVELFPSDMKLCAWAAIPTSCYGIYFSCLNAYANRIFFSRETLAAGHYGSAIQLGLEYTLGPLICLLTIRAAIRYLHRPDFGPARTLAMFWVASAWYIGTFLLMLWAAFGEGSLDSNGRALLSSLSMRPRCLTIAVALIAYHDWRKRLQRQS
jgi:hypothetical protein